MAYDLSSISEEFQIGGDFIRGEPYGTGHIHETFAVYVSTETEMRRYLLQKINQQVFVKPVQVMENIDRVTRHLRSKLEKRGVPDIERAVLTPIETRQGKLLCQDEAGEYWRMYVFIEGAKTYDTPKNLDQVFEAARAYGDFQLLLRDLPGPKLHETIPAFCNGPKRFTDFQLALQQDACDRSKEAKREIAYLEKEAATFDLIPKLVGTKEIPLCTTHNDTKINNVLLDDRDGKAVCVVDLDTVMESYSLYDFGDLVRSSLGGISEDSTHLSKLVLELPKFEAITKGYLSSIGAFLNPVERKHLVHAAKVVTLMIGTRFLTDFLEGDRYFKVSRPGQNLDRCRRQFKLVDAMKKKERELGRLVGAACSEVPFQGQST